MDDLTPFQDEKQNATLNGNYKFMISQYFQTI